MLDPALGFYMLVMLISGAANTILMKHQTMQLVPQGAGETPVAFDHPYIQTFFMFIGEMFCLAVFSILVCRKTSRDKKKEAQKEAENKLEQTELVDGVIASKTSENASTAAVARDDKQPILTATESSVDTVESKVESKSFLEDKDLSWPEIKVQLLFILPVVCDCCATTLVNYSYLLIPASVIQMTRGSVVLFTAIFSIVFLGRRQTAQHWSGVALVVLGITFVSLSQLDIGGESKAIVTGLTMTIVAQMFQASMMVVEEKFVGSYAVSPLLAVGLEGFFGCCILFVVIPIVNATSSEENVTGAFYQLGHSGILLASVIASIFSIAFFNWAGITVTQQASCVARSTIDCSRTVLIWAFEMSMGWAGFHWMQLVGFIILMAGTLLYNGVIEIKALDEVFGKPEKNEIEDENSKQVESEKAKLEVVKGQLLNKELIINKTTAGLVAGSSTTSGSGSGTASSGGSDEEGRALLEAEAKKKTLKITTKYGASSASYGTTPVVVSTQ